MQEILRLAKKQLRAYSQSPSPVWWAKYGYFSKTLASSLPPARKPILVLSLPRSGSSWVGSILGSSSNALYLREPITQTYVNCANTIISTIDIRLNDLPATYKSSADSAFSGLPVFPEAIVRVPSQWSLFERTKRTLVIKEVNPLALAWFIDQYQPKIVYLIRHPAALAYSWHALKWVVPPINQRVARENSKSKSTEHKEPADTFWSLHGAFQASILKYALNILDNYEDKTLITYEDICLNPRESFLRLYDFCDLKWDSGVELEIQKCTTSANPYQAGQYGECRESSSLARRWETLISEEQLIEVRDAYLLADLPYYTSDKW